MEAVKHNPESPSLSSFSTIAAALGLRQLRTFLAGDSLTVLAGYLGALRLAWLGLAPGHAQVDTLPPGDRVAGGLWHQEADLLLGLPANLSLDLSGNWRAVLAVKTDLGLCWDTVVGGEGAAD